MKKSITFLLCAVLLLPLFGCGKKSAGNDLWDDAAPNNGILNYYSFDKNGGFQLGTFNDEDKYDLLDRLSAVNAIPVTDWTADKVKLPVYGIEIPSEDGWGIHAAWSDGFLILRDGSVYQFDFDFTSLEKDYQWERTNRFVESLAAMPCGRLLSEGPDGWIANRLSPANELTAPEGVTTTLKEQADRKITVTLTNSGSTEWCYGEHFSLQVLLDGVWYGVPDLDDLNYGFTDIGYSLPAGECKEESYNLSMYGDLPDGTYRLVMYGLNVEFDLPYTGTDDEVTCVVPCSVLSIVDHSLDDPDLAFAMAVEPIWEDETNVYSFSCIKSQYVTVYYDDGTEEDVKTALQAGRVTMDDLNTFGIGFITEPKA